MLYLLPVKLQYLWRLSLVSRCAYAFVALGTIKTDESLARNLVYVVVYDVKNIRASRGMKKQVSG